MPTSLDDLIAALNRDWRNLDLLAIITDLGEEQGLFWTPGVRNLFRGKRHPRFKTRIKPNRVPIHVKWVEHEYRPPTKGWKRTPKRPPVEKEFWQWISTNYDNDPERRDSTLPFAELLHYKAVDPENPAGGPYTRMQYFDTPWEAYKMAGIKSLEWLKMR